MVLAARQFGGALNEDERNPIIGVTAEELLGADPERVLIFVLNLSPNSVYMGLRQTVSSTNGILLASNGGGVSFNAVDDGTIPTRQFFVVAGGAGSQLYVLTLRRESLGGGGEIL